MKTDELSSIINIYLGRRGIGNTYLMLNGVKNVDKCVVLVKNKSDADYMQNMIGQRINWVTPHTIDKLRGTNTPIAIDHRVNIEIISGLLGEITRLRGELVVMSDLVRHRK